MKTVPLHGKHAHGRVASVDDADYEEASQYHWMAHKPNPRSDRIYPRAFIRFAPGPDGKRQIYLHSLITGWVGVDHADRDTLNNTRSNLRQANASQNGVNRGPKPGGSSAYKGIYWFKPARLWKAQTKVNGQLRSVGYFKDEEAAARAYDAAARAAHGEFAWLNFPDTEDI